MRPVFQLIHRLHIGHQTSVEHNHIHIRTSLKSLTYIRNIHAVVTFLIPESTLPYRIWRIKAAVGMRRKCNSFSLGRIQRKDIIDDFLHHFRVHRILVRISLLIVCCTFPLLSFPIRYNVGTELISAYTNTLALISDLPYPIFMSLMLAFKYCFKSFCPTIYKGKWLPWAGLRQALLVRIVLAGCEHATHH